MVPTIITDPGGCIRAWMLGAIAQACPCVDDKPPHEILGYAVIFYPDERHTGPGRQVWPSNGQGAAVLLDRLPTEAEVVGFLRQCLVDEIMAGED